MIQTGLKAALFKVYAVLIYIFIFAPIGIVVLFTFNENEYPVFPLTGFTLKWFDTITTGPYATQIQASFKTSVIIAGITGIVVGVLGTITAYGLVRYRFKSRSFLNIFVLLPLIMPYILYGISLFTFYSLLHIPYSIWTMVIGHTVITLPFAVIIISASLWGFNRNLEEASSDLGANELTTFRKITFPLIKNGIIAGTLIGFLLSFNEFVVAFFTQSRGATPLTMYMYGMWWTQPLPSLNVISTTIIGIVAVIYIIFVIIFPKALKFSV